MKCIVSKLTVCTVELFYVAILFTTPTCGSSVLAVWQGSRCGKRRFVLKLSTQDSLREMILSYRYFSRLHLFYGKTGHIQFRRQPDYNWALQVLYPLPFSWNVWGHCFQNHLLNPDIGERGGQLSGYPRHNQEPLHEDATELLGSQLGRSWSDR